MSRAGSAPTPGTGRTLAIRAGALGDTIVAIPAIDALGRLGDVEVLGTMPYVELVRADATHSIDRAMFRALFDDGPEDGELIDFLGRFDRVVAWSNPPLLADKLDALGIELIQSTPLPPAGVHASDHLLAALEPLGIAGPAPAPSVVPAEVVSDYPPKFVALHPGSGSAAKNWEHFEALAHLVRSAGLEIVWIQGEAERNIVPELAQRVPGQVARELPLRELAALLAKSDVFVGNDSGVSHLAAAVGAPTLAVFRSTDPARWGPRGPRVRVVEAGASPEAVWAFARELMRER